MICSVVYRFRAIPFSPQSRLEIAGFAQSTWYRFRGAHHCEQADSPPAVPGAILKQGGFLHEKRNLGRAVMPPKADAAPLPSKQRLALGKFSITLLL
jgi:hypothetical protein